MTPRAASDGRPCALALANKYGGARTHGAWRSDLPLNCEDDFCSPLFLLVSFRALCDKAIYAGPQGVGLAGHREGQS